MRILLTSGAERVCTVEVQWDTNGDYIARIKESYPANIWCRDWRRAVNLHAYGPTIQDALDNLREKLLPFWTD